MEEADHCETTRHTERRWERGHEHTPVHAVGCESGGRSALVPLGLSACALETAVGRLPACGAWGVFFCWKEETGPDKESNQSTPRPFAIASILIQQPRSIDICGGLFEREYCVLFSKQNGWPMFFNLCDASSRRSRAPVLLFLLPPIFGPAHPHAPFGYGRPPASIEIAGAQPFGGSFLNGCV